MKCGHLDIPAKLHKGGWINESPVLLYMPLHIAYTVLFNAWTDLLTNQCCMIWYNRQGDASIYIPSCIQPPRSLSTAHCPHFDFILSQRVR